MMTSFCSQISWYRCDSWTELAPLEHPVEVLAIIAGFVVTASSNSDIGDTELDFPSLMGVLWARWGFALMSVIDSVSFRLRSTLIGVFVAVPDSLSVTTFNVVIDSLLPLELVFLEPGDSDDSIVSAISLMSESLANIFHSPLCLAVGFLHSEHEGHPQTNTKTYLRSDSDWDISD